MRNKSHKNRRPPGKKKDAGGFGSNLFLIEGESGLSEYLMHRPSALKEVYCRSPKEIKWVRSLCQGDLKIQTTDDWSRSPELPSRQSVWGLGEHFVRSEAEIQHVVEGREKNLIVALDHITDPRNLGAIVRSAAFFGVHEVIAPKNRQILFNDAAIKTSQGGFAHADLFGVTNLVRSLQKLKESGYWIVGADGGGEPISDVAGVYDKVVLVLGAEGKGLSRLVRKECDRIVAIHGAEVGVESLNVSVATGILLNSFKL